MKKSMFLLEIFQKSIYGSPALYKRRIARDPMDAEDWVRENAQKWVLFPVEIECDAFGNGAVYLESDRESSLYTFTCTKIAVI